MGVTCYWDATLAYENAYINADIESGHRRAVGASGTLSAVGTLEKL